MDSKKQLYAFELDDYAAPSCTSFTKLYFGTVDDFRAVLDNAAEEQLEEERNTFEHFVAGERKVIYHAGQCVTRFARPTKLIKEKPLEFERISYTYENSYGFYYKCRISKAVGRVALAKLGKQFYIVYWVTATNPRYKDELIPHKTSVALGDMIWGFPGVLKIKGKTIQNLLGVIDSIYKTEQEAKARYNNLSALDLNRFFEDVFGDG